jgi:hypothetical protein
MQLISFDSSRSSIMDLYALDSFILSDTITPRTSPMFLPGYICAAWAVRRMFSARLRGSVKDPLLWRMLSPLLGSCNRHTTYCISRIRGLLMTSRHYMGADSTVVPGNSSLDLISVAAHPVRPHHLIGRTPVFKPGAGIGAGTMLGRSVARGSVQGGILAPATLGLRNPITGLSLLRHCRLRMNIVASRPHLLVHRWCD